MELIREALAVQHAWRGLLHIAPARIRSVAMPCGGCRKQRHGTGVASLIPRDTGSMGGIAPLPALGGGRLGALRLAQQPVLVCGPCDRAPHGLGQQMIPFTRSRRMPVGAAGCLSANLP